MKTIKIKLCGMMRDCDIDFANEAQPDYVGFVFADTRRKIDKATARRFKNNLNPGIAAVGVFVDEDPDKVAELLFEGIIDIAQLHGSETASYIKTLRSYVPDCRIIKAVKVQGAEDILQAARLPCDYLLLDTYRQGVLGGTGETFAWELIREAQKDQEEGSARIFGKPYFLAGGLNMENIEAAAGLSPYGVDLSSGIETDGAKDKDKMIEIVRRIRNV